MKKDATKIAFQAKIKEEASQVSRPFVLEILYFVSTNNLRKEKYHEIIMSGEFKLWFLECNERKCLFKKFHFLYTLLNQNNSRYEFFWRDCSSKNKKIRLQESTESRKDSSMAKTLPIKS